MIHYKNKKEAGCRSFVKQSTMSHEGTRPIANGTELDVFLSKISIEIIASEEDKIKNRLQILG